jgi:hypothetical protein
LHPFVQDAEKATLLRGAEPWASRGGWRWQGRYNVYDTRMHAYFAGHEKGAVPKQTRQDWQAIWGQAGEQDSLLLTGPGATKTITADGVNPAALLLQLDRLALPSELRGDLNQQPPGADLVGLGLKKK